MWGVKRRQQRRRRVAGLHGRRRGGGGGAGGGAGDGMRWRTIVSFAFCLQVLAKGSKGREARRPLQHFDGMTAPWHSRSRAK